MPEYIPGGSEALNFAFYMLIYIGAFFIELCFDGLLLAPDISLGMILVYCFLATLVIRFLVAIPIMTGGSTYGSKDDRSSRSSSS